MHKRLLLILIGLSLISSCGFKLRGNFEMSEALSTLSIEGGERELVDQLEELLEKSGTSVVAQDIESPSLNLSKSEFIREVRTTDSNGVATGFKYTYQIDYRVIDAQGAELLPWGSTFQIRTAEYAAGNELEIEEEEEFLIEEMQKEIVLQIMRKLARI